jgi:hypothetical protein
MNATKTTRQTDGPIETHDYRFPTIEAALVKSQVARIAKEGKEAKTMAPTNQGTTSPKPSPKATIIEAKIDVGYGNSLFIRGRGAELSWDKGLPLKCMDRSTWVWSTTQATDKLVFKLLLNDTAWARGEDVVIASGKRIEIVPGF